MTFQHGAALAASLGDFGGFPVSTLTARGDHVFGSYPHLISRNDSGASNDTKINTVNLFLDSLSDDFSYAASIVEACQDATVYAMQCTAGPATVTIEGLVGDSGCGPTGKVVTLTQGPSTYVAAISVATSTAGHSVAAVGKENCVLSGTTAATCTASVTVTVDGTTTQTAATTPLSGASYHRFDVAITAGAEKTASPTGTCAKASSGVTTKSLAVWALTAIVSVTGLLVAA